MDRTTRKELLMALLDKATRIEENTRACARELRALRASSLGPTASEERAETSGSRDALLKKLLEEA